MISAIKRLFGALKSGNPAARVGIFIRLVSPITKLADLITPRPSSENQKIPPVIIITSPPRSGSTVTFQTLTRLLPVRYVSNWHALFPTNASKFMLKKNLFGKGLKGFKNYYGYTADMRDVNEANSFFDEIFEGNPEKKEIRKRFKRFIDRISPDGGPVLLKNVRNFANMGLLFEAVPELFFLRIKRNLEQNVQSVLRAYYELGGFHPIPNAIKNMSMDNPQVFSVHQILEINKEIDKQSQLVKDEHWMELSYEQFCNDTLAIVKRVAQQLGIEEREIRFDAFNEPLKASFSQKVSNEDARKIKEILNTAIQ